MQNCKDNLHIVDDALLDAISFCLWCLDEDHPMKERACEAVRKLREAREVIVSSCLNGE